MNVYEKVLTISYEFQKRNVKKTGYNKFVGYSYFELSDIVPVLNELMLEYKLMSHISYGKEEATMKLVDAEKPEDYLEYSCPMAEVTLKGAHAIQNMGAQQTYVRRYFYMTAFNIVENDYFDAVQGKEEFDREKLRKEIVEICKKRNGDGKYVMQIGVDVFSGYEGKGYASHLVALLKDKIIEKGFTPFYGTCESHAISSNIAMNAGFLPAFSEFFAAKANDKTI